MSQLGHGSVDRMNCEGQTAAESVVSIASLFLSLSLSTLAKTVNIITRLTSLHSAL